MVPSFSLLVQSEVFIVHNPPTLFFFFTRENFRPVMFFCFSCIFLHFKTFQVKVWKGLMLNCDAVVDTHTLADDVMAFDQSAALLLSLLKTFLFMVFTRFH